MRIDRLDTLTLVAHGRLHLGFLDPSGSLGRRFGSVGLAIEGFDPVAYFTDQLAIQGLPDFEAAESGAVWRFRNEGNRASFVSYPEVYGPRFGGYDPVDVARGVTYAGNPRIWLIADRRLYLFGREKSRDAFAANPARFSRRDARLVNHRLMTAPEVAKS